MKKILVPTDFSANSLAGLQFALQWSIQQKLELVFIHVMHIIKASQWTDGYYKEYADQMKKLNTEKLEKFVEQAMRNMGIRPAKHSCILIAGISPDIAIRDYCRKNPDIDYICISTRGANRLKKFLGTNTGNLITKSKVPVIAIPKNYKAMPVENILYATDFRNYKEELQKVISFARPLKAKVEVLHFAWPDETFPDIKLFEKIFRKELNYPLRLHFEKTDIMQSLVQHLQKQIRLTRPSVVIMFTDQNRNLYQRIFLSSKAEELSFQSIVPLLVFNKNDQKGS